MEIIKLKHSDNFRDLGGTPTKDGRTIKPRMLIRGKNLFKLTKTDIKTLTGDFNLKTIIDLRCNKEIDEKPDFVPEGVTYLQMPVSGETKLGISHEKKIHSFDSLYLIPKMELMYADLIQDDCHENVIKIINTILNMKEDDFSILFHCTAGKDRTGIIAALLLEFLGVEREIIYKDYLFTNKVQNLKAKLAYLGLLIIKHDLQLCRKIHDSLIAKASYLDAFYSVIEKDYETVNEFIQKELNLSDNEIESIKNKFLE